MMITPERAAQYRTARMNPGTLGTAAHPELYTGRVGVAYFGHRYCKESDATEPVYVVTHRDLCTLGTYSHGELHDFR